MTNEVNQIVSFVFDTQAKMEASVGYKADDLYKVALIKDTKVFHVLTNWETGEWTAIGSTSGSSGTVVAYPYNSAGIQFAVNAIEASGRPGTVLFAAVPYDGNADIEWKKSVSGKGFLGNLTFNVQYIPDQDVNALDGTVINLAPGVTGIKYNNVDLPNPVRTDLSNSGGTSIFLENLTFVGGLRGIHTGAKNTLGLLYGAVKNCRFFNQTEEHYIFDNFQHMQFENLWAWNSLTGVVAGGCVFRASRLRKVDNSIALLPGNSVWTGTIFGYAKDYLGRGIMVQALDGQLNQCSFAAARVQFNRYTAFNTARDVVLTPANGTANFTVSDSTQFSYCQVGMPLAIPATSSQVSGVSNGVVYYVSSRDPGTNIITLNELPHRTTGNVVSNAATPVTMKCGGFLGVSALTDDNGSITSFDFGNLDIECKGNVNSFATRNCKGRAYALELMPSDTDTQTAFRFGDFALSHSGLTTITTDRSTSQGYCRVTNLSGGVTNYSGGSFTLTAAMSGQKLRYSGTADIIVTVPGTLPRDFKWGAVCTNTGQITMQTSLGAAFQNRSATAKTAGGTAPQVNVESISVSAGGHMFHLWGDLGGV